MGVAADPQVADRDNSAKVCLYEPAGPLQQADLNVMVHSPVANPAIGNETDAAVGGLDGALNVTITPLSETLEFWPEPARVVSVFSMILVLALLLASLGIYEMVSYGVSRRVREIGIRVALGAEDRDVMRLAIRQAMFPVLAGALMGVVLCAATSSMVSPAFSAILFGVSPLDSGSFVGIPLFLLAVAFLAGYVPARRAMRVVPMVDLKYE